MIAMGYGRAIFEPENAFREFRGELQAKVTRDFADNQAVKRPLSLINNADEETFHNSEREAS